MTAKLDPESVTGEVGDFVRALVAGCGLQLEVRTVLRGDCVTVELSGEDEGYLFEDGARLLYAINHLVSQVFYRRCARPCSFLVDCGNYRADRTTELELMALKAAEQVRHTGVRVVLQPMPATERRVIHLALAGAEGVRTVSEGNGRYRRVLIVPA